MARSFDGIDDDIDWGSPASTDSIFDSGGTIFVWNIKDNAAAERLVYKITGTRGYYIHGFTSGADYLVEFLQDFAPTNGAWDTTDNALTVGVWNTIAVIYNNSSADNNPLIFANGISAGITEILTPVGTRTDDVALNLWLGSNNTTSVPWTGDLAFFCAWKDELSDNEMTALRNGIHPFIIRSDSITLLATIEGNDSPEGDYNGQQSSGIITGTIKAPTNPPVEPLENY